MRNENTGLHKLKETMAMPTEPGLYRVYKVTGKHPLIGHIEVGQLLPAQGVDKAVENESDAAKAELHAVLEECSVRVGLDPALDKPVAYTNREAKRSAERAAKNRGK